MKKRNPVAREIDNPTGMWELWCWLACEKTRKTGRQDAAQPLRRLLDRACPDHSGRTSVRQAPFLFRGSGGIRQELGNEHE